jgi:hypothetical protein
MDQLEEEVEEAETQGTGEMIEALLCCAVLLLQSVRSLLC